METSYGLKFELTKVVNPEWDSYNKTVASCHFGNVGVIIVDIQYHMPIDNEYDLEEIYRMIENGEQELSTSIIKYGYTLLTYSRWLKP